MFRGCSWLCTQESLLAGSGMLGIEPGWTACKASAFSTVLSFWSQKLGALEISVNVLPNTDTLLREKLSSNGTISLGKVSSLWLCCFNGFLWILNSNHQLISIHQGSFCMLTWMPPYLHLFAEEPPGAVRALYINLGEAFPDPGRDGGMMETLGSLSCFWLASQEAPRMKEHAWWKPDEPQWLRTPDPFSQMDLISSYMWLEMKSWGVRGQSNSCYKRRGHSPLKEIP